MIILLFLISLEPLDTIYLDRECNSIEIHNNKIYCAPFTGKSIFVLTDSKKLKPITFTDNPNYRIFDFFVTPFAIYFNNGKSIDKFYLASGTMENIFNSQDISSFIITPSEEVILYERQKRELVFLDFTNSIRFKKPDMKVRNLHFANGLLYILTRKALFVSDEHGNTVEKKTIPEKVDRIFVDSTDVLLFPMDKKFVYLLDNICEKIEISHGVRDISGNNEFIVMLDESGSILYIYGSTLIE